ncbi:MAG: SLC13 family permease [Lachnospiraceae bacterium]|nr:SLC13 family permease [Lachnospiraceae bacterium]
MLKALKKINISYFGSGFFILLALLIMIIKPFSANLNDTAQLMLGGILISLSIWIFKPFDLSYAVGGFFLGFFALALGLKPAVVFSGFTQSAIWILIPALFFGFTLQKTGLGKRIAIGIIKIFKPSYVSLVFAWVLIGIIISLMTPSSTVRIAIMIPIAAQCCELCRLEKGSKGNSLIILTAFGMAVFPGMGWMSGSLWGPIISGMINSVPETEGIVTFYSWFNVLFIPLMIVTLVLIAGSLLVLKPKEKLPPDALDAIKKLTVTKITKSEIITILILVAAFTMFLTHGLHGIPDAAVCLAAVFLFFLTGVLEAKDFNNGVNWDLVVFIAMALSFGAIFTETGISMWFAGIVVPVLAPVAGNPYLFMFSVMIFVFLWKFLDVALFIPTIAILVPILPSIQEAYQISPLVWMFVFIMAANSFVLVYQNIWAMMTKTLAGDRTFTHKQIGVYGIIYFIACFIALLVAIPIWSNAGLFG